MPDRDDHIPSDDGSTETAFPPDRAPERIGPYKILEKIGQGGMGVVYLAEQDAPLRRRVALKLIKLGMDTTQVVARFEAERQALALMDHPSIAKVFDAGATEQGRPYFVMEHVPGEPITDYCDRHRLRVKERLNLFVQVCHAIQHAHQKGIIHRDLKPRNLLVMVQDEAPVPKVIDFGVAKATAHRLTERTVFTELGHLIGTPEYMSPEQAEMTGLNVDTRTDIYSLGVVLYELLAGDLPFDAKALREGGLERIQRTIRDQEPLRPSMRVSRPGERSSRAAERRRTTLPFLRRQLRHELDWITMRALEKDRTRRYQTASELGADVERYLRDEPVLASPPGQLYRLRKYVKRHKGPVAATAALLLSFVAFGSVSWWQGQRAKAEGLAARANAVLATAASADDPVVKALLVRELDGSPGLSMTQFGRAQAFLGEPLPIAVVSDARVAAISPDGTRIVTGSGDGTARVWHADGVGAPVVLSGHSGPLVSVEFNPDGTRIVTCGVDATARLWRLEGGDALILRGHEGPVLRARFSRDGKSLVTSSADDTARIWRADGIGEPIVLRGHTDQVQDASFSPDGRRVVTASKDGTARVWRSDGSSSVLLAGHEGSVNSAAFSPDGERLVTASDDRTARVWRADGIGTEIVLNGHDGRVTSAEFDREGRLVLTASEDRTARVWKADGTGVPGVLEGHEREIWWAGFAPGGTRILTVSEDGTARLWEPDVPDHGGVMLTLPAEAWRGKRIRFRAQLRFEADSGPGGAQLWLEVDRPTGIGFFDNEPDRPISSSQWREYEIVGDVAEDASLITVGLALSGSGRAWIDAAHLEPMDGLEVSGGGLIDGDFEASRMRWSLARGNGYAAAIVAENPAVGRSCLRLASTSAPSYRSDVVARHRTGIRTASFDLSGQRFLTSSADGTARSWRADGAGGPVVLKGNGEWGESASFSPDGERIVMASTGGTARVWRADGTGEPVVLRGHSSSVSSASFNPDGKRIVTASDDSTARVWRADGTGEPVVLRGHSGSVHKASFSPDGERIVTASSDGTARVWRADGTGQPVVLKGHGEWVGPESFSPDGERIVTASRDMTARVWRADGTGEPVVLRGHSAEVKSASFSPDGERIVTASFDNTARVWRADGTGEPVVLRGHSSWVWSASFSPDGERIVTASFDKTVRVWRADGTGEPVVLRGHSAAVRRASFSPDGERIVTASDDGTARVWRADGTGEPVALKGHTGEVRNASFSPDGERILTASNDGTARVWPATWRALFRYQLRKLTLCLQSSERMQYLGESGSEASERHAACETRYGRSPSAGGESTGQIMVGR